jgi:predicted dehydrogenase
MSKFRVGIVGCGQIASTFEDDPLREHPCTHAGAYVTVKGVNLVSAADIDESKLHMFSKKWGVSSIYTDYTDMIEKEKLDIVSVATPTPTHSEITIKAAECGVKAIFCEKPIASSLDEADKMINVCEREGTILLINHTRRWDPNYHKIKQYVKNYIGGTISVTGICRSGLLLNGTHLFDMLRFIVGDVDWVFGSVEKSETTKSITDPGGAGYLYFKNGAHGYVDSSSQKNYHIFEVDVLGMKGRARVSDDGRNVEFWKAEKSKKYGGYNELASQKITTSRKKNSMVAAVENLIECIEQDKECLCTGEDGRAALELALAFHESDRLGKKVKLPLKNRRLRVISR